MGRCEPPAEVSEEMPGKSCVCAGISPTVSVCVFAPPLLPKVILGKSGGEKEHTLTIAEMPAHRHQMNKASSAGGDGSGYAWSSTSLQNDTGVQQVGGGGAHNNLQPYRTAQYMIKT